MTTGVSLAAPNQRTLIVGRTGSGKTVAALFHLSQANLEDKPWVVIDFKGDENINSIQNIEYIKPDADLSRIGPGLYVLRLRVDQQAQLEQFLWNVYERENMGIMADEGYMIGQGARFSPAFRAILTQGRSKNIGVIINSQRPVWLDVFAKSEANKIQIYHLNSVKDRNTISEFLGDALGPDVQERLAPYHSIYYDIDTNTAVELGPVPPPDVSVKLIEARLAAIRQYKDVQVPTVRERTIKRV